MLLSPLSRLRSYTQMKFDFELSCTQHMITLLPLGVGNEINLTRGERFIQGEELSRGGGGVGGERLRHTTSNIHSVLIKFQEKICGIS